MARLAGKNAIFSTTTGGAEDVTCTSWELNTTGDALDSTGMDSSGHRAFVAGLDSWAATVNAFWDTANSKVIGATPTFSMGQTVACVFELLNDATITDRWTGNAIVTAFNVSAPVDGLITFVMELQGTGALTHPTTAT